jgi:Flp pilus assembly protein TadD
MTPESNSSTQCDDHAMSSVLAAMQDSAENALRLLHEMLANWPLDSRLWFLRGAVRADQQQYGEARADFVQAITLAPDFHVARFMLGLLELMNAHVAGAIATWSPLDHLAEDDSLRVLKSGLVNLTQDRFDVALEQLKRGLALNQQHPLIDGYVRAVIERIAAACPDSAPVAGDSAHDPHRLLPGYPGSQTLH